MGQRGGLSQKPAQATESAGPLLPLPFRLLWHPPLPRGESVCLSVISDISLDIYYVGDIYLLCLLGY